MNYNYAQQQRNPGKHMVGITFVIVFHVLLVVALKAGLGTKLLEVVNQKVETKIVEEVAPPPPPDVPPPPPPKMDLPPPPSFIPPPEVSIQPQVQQAPTITATTQAKPEGPPPPPRPVHDAAPPPPPPVAPAKTVSAAECPNVGDVGGYASEEWEKIAEKDGLDKGSLTVEFIIGAAGEINPGSIKVSNASHPSLSRLATKIATKLRCKGQGVEVKAKYAVAFKLE